MFREKCWFVAFSYNSFKTLTDLWLVFDVICYLLLKNLRMLILLIFPYKYHWRYLFYNCTKLNKNLKDFQCYSFILWFVFLTVWFVKFLIQINLILTVFNWIILSVNELGTRFSLKLLSHKARSQVQSLWTTNCLKISKLRSFTARLQLVSRSFTTRS